MVPVAGDDQAVAWHVRLAKHDDIPFVLDLARANRGVLCFKEQDVHVVKAAVAGRIGIDERIGTTRFTIVERSSADPCGFMLSIRYDSLLYGFANELYLLAVGSASRRSGAGWHLVADAIASTASLAQCTVAIARSDEAVSLLTKRFAFVPSMKSNSRGLVLRRCAISCTGADNHNLAKKPT